MAGRGTKFYRKNEAKLMAHLGLKPTSNSGAGWIEKADGQNEQLIVELKSTDAMSMSVKLKDLVKLEEQSLVVKKLPVFIVQFLQTDEVFLMVRPHQIVDVAKYIETGIYVPPEDMVEFKDIKPKQVPLVKSSSKGREQFHKEREAKYKK